ncbi:unnamed protein product [Prorocentrum cordatum]|nr:unnamed protein product [Polarella glacialis]
MKFVSTALSGNRHIHELNLADNSISDIGALHLSRALLSNTTLSVLNLGRNIGLGCKGLAYIIESAGASVSSIHLTDCRTVDSDITLVETAMYSNCHLKIVDDVRNESALMHSLILRNNLLSSDSDWGAVLATLSDTVIVNELLLCVGVERADLRGDVVQLRQELTRGDQSKYSAPSCSLRQAMGLCAYERLRLLLPPTLDRNLRASMAIELCMRRLTCRANGLPALWLRVQSEIGPTPIFRLPRRDRCVLVIGPGFGFGANPQQIQILRDGGWLVHTPWLTCPASVNFSMSDSIGTLVTEVVNRAPDAIVAASKGGSYLLELWRLGITIPAVLINVHPNCHAFPSEAPVVVCHGSRDTVYQRSLDDLEALMRGTNSQKHLLYYSSDSGVSKAGKYLRCGDQHVMESLQHHDLLNRLVDAAISTGSVGPLSSPDQHLIETWRGFVTDTRRRAEQFLGFSPGYLQRFWKTESFARDGENCLHSVDELSQEFAAVRDIFLAEPPQSRRTGLYDRSGGWGSTCVKRVQRIENGALHLSLQAKYDGLVTSLRLQEVPFKADIHMRWLFHGPGTMGAVDSISNGLDGFNPLMTGSTFSPVWGSGVYFAVDGQYASSPPYAAVLPTGDKQIFLCLVATGMPCTASADRTGTRCLLPFRRGKQRYNSTVDSLSNPEIVVVQNGSQALPAYLITFSEAR